MYDVKIINNEAFLFRDTIKMKNLESLRLDGLILYEFNDGSYVTINSINLIEWYDSDGKQHRDGDMPALISTNGYMMYSNHDKIHRVGGPAFIRDDGSVAYWLDGVYYPDEEEYKNRVREYELITNHVIPRLPWCKNHKYLLDGNCFTINLITAFAITMILLKHYGYIYHVC